MKNMIMALLGLALTSSISSSAQSGDHGGKEHGGKAKTEEQEGKELNCEKNEKAVKNEESGKMECHEKEKDDKTSMAPLKLDRKISVAEIKTALTDYIAANSDKNSIYRYTDKDRANQKLDLKFVKIHDPVRHMEKKGQFFACTDFSVVGKEGRLHDLDFWMVPTTTGLKIVRTKVHKDPKLLNKKWKKVPRYTFSDEDIVPITR